MRERASVRDTGYRMRTTTRAAGLRTSDAERQRVADFLRDACADGRLAAEELEERLDRLFSSATVADVERLVWDLPGGAAVVPRLGFRPGVAVPARRRARSPVPPAALMVIGGGLLILMALTLPPILALVSLAIVVAVAVALVTLVAALAPAGLFLFGLAWLVSRLFRGRRPGPRGGWPPRRHGHPFQ